MAVTTQAGRGAPIRYSRGYKYQLDETYVHRLTVPVPKPIHHPFFRIIGTELIVHAGYAWDGPSGPTFDTKSFMRGSLVHDVLYQAMEMGLMSLDYREAADQELERICEEDGMWKARRWWVYHGVRFRGDEAIAHGPRPVLVAP
jgi:hypothetical protein